MKIPNQKSINKNDFDEEFQPLAEQLSDIVDYNTEQVFNALNKNISLADNIAGFSKEIDVVVDSSGIPTTSIKLNSTLVPSRPVGALVVDHINLTNSTIYPTGGIMISYSELSGVITVNHITGLPVNNKFRLKVVFFA